MRRTKGYKVLALLLMVTVLSTLVLGCEVRKLVLAKRKVKHRLLIRTTQL